MTHCSKKDVILGICMLTVVGCSGSTRDASSLPARICDQNGCRDRTATERTYGDAFDTDAFLARARAARTVSERQTEEEQVDATLQRIEEERSERFRLEARAEDRVSEERNVRREEREADQVSVPLRCRRRVRSFAALLRGSLTCGDSGFATTGLFDGDCPVTACIVRVQDDANPFGGPLDF